MSFSFASLHLLQLHSMQLYVGLACIASVRITLFHSRQATLRSAKKPNGHMCLYSHKIHLPYISQSAENKCSLAQVQAELQAQSYEIYARQWNVFATTILKKRKKKLKGCGLAVKFIYTNDYCNIRELIGLLNYTQLICST